MKKIFSNIALFVENLILLPTIIRNSKEELRAEEEAEGIE